MTDFAAVRRMMVDGQIRTSDVTNARLVAALLEVPRERFVPREAAGLAYVDLDVPVSRGATPRCLLKPMVLAKLIQAADPKDGERVLDVGCATGYSSAVLARLAGQVTALEQDAVLARQAAEALAGAANVAVVTGALGGGWPQNAPYDVIVLQGATEIAPQTLCGQLADGGRLVCVLADGPVGKAMVYRRSGGEISGRPAFDAAAPLLPGFAKTPIFAF